MRYIDADKIPYTDLSEGHGFCWVTFMDWIKKMPTADVIEVGIKYYESAGYRIIAGEDISERVEGRNDNFVRLPAGRWFKIERI